MRLPPPSTELTRSSTSKIGLEAEYNCKKDIVNSSGGKGDGRYCGIKMSNSHEIMRNALNE